MKTQNTLLFALICGGVWSANASSSYFSGFSGMVYNSAKDAGKYALGILYTKTPPTVNEVDEEWENVNEDIVDRDIAQNLDQLSDDDQSLFFEEQRNKISLVQKENELLKKESAQQKEKMEDMKHKLKFAIEVVRGMQLVKQYDEYTCEQRASGQHLGILYTETPPTVSEVNLEQLSGDDHSLFFEDQRKFFEDQRKFFEEQRTKISLVQKENELLKKEIAQQKETMEAMESTLKFTIKFVQDMLLPDDTTQTQSTEQRGNNIKEAFAKKAQKQQEESKEAQE